LAVLAALAGIVWLSRRKLENGIVNGTIPASTGDYYHDRLVHSAVASPTSPTGTIALYCSTGGRGGSKGCKAFAKYFTKVEDKIADYYTFGLGRAAINGSVFIQQKAFQIVKPIGQYVGVEAADAARWTARTAGTVIGGVEDAASAVGGAVAGAGITVVHAAEDTGSFIKGLFS